MLNIFSKRTPPPITPPPRVDFHSHLLPGIDDGVSSLEESVEILKKFESLGYEKIITTPHIMSDFYKNTPEIIQTVLRDLQNEIGNSLNIKIDAAAEYYLDEAFIEQLDNPGDLLYIHEKYLLFETGFMAKPVYLLEAIFKMQSQGIKPILAHPERYSYLQQDWALVEDLINRGVYFQINLNSLIGYYSKEVQKFCMKLIRSKNVHFIGSDCHNLSHMDITFEALNSKQFQELLSLEILNDTFLD